MSATGRGSKRIANDVYCTPDWCVRALMKNLKLPHGLWLEPCAGDGAIIEAVSVCGVWALWHTFDIRPECEESLHAQSTVTHICAGVDFLDAIIPYYDVCMTNPPYALAMEFVQKAIRYSRITVMLLRLNWLGSQTRNRFLIENPPSVYVLPRRPAFVNGRTDACEYAWFVWGLGMNELRVLPLEDCK